MTTCSVILCVRNDERRIERSVRSILYQTLKDIELLIVDDASTDATASILNRLSEEDHRIKIYTNSERLERSRSRNFAAFEMASTPYLAIMDSDDISLPNRLETQVNYLNDNPSVIGIGGQILFLSDNNTVTGGFKVPIGIGTVNSRLYRHNPLINSAMVLRAEFFKKVGGYDPSMVFSEDYDLFMRMSRFGEFDNLNEPLLLCHTSWDKEQKVHYQRRLNHIKVRLREILRLGFAGVKYVPGALIYLVTALLPPTIMQTYRRNKYTKTIDAQERQKYEAWIARLCP